MLKDDTTRLNPELERGFPKFSPLEAETLTLRADRGLAERQPCLRVAAPRFELGTTPVPGFGRKVWFWRVASAMAFQSGRSNAPATCHLKIVAFRWTRARNLTSRNAAKYDRGGLGLWVDPT